MKTPLLLCAAVAATFTACESREEKIRKQELENKADALEKQAKAAEEKSKRDADAIRKQGELDKEKLKNEADKTRDQK